ncbi:Rhodanese-like domain-containing protein [Hygrophoropsis aurantiaca]|uniref:Rhodanese-like domain-containing protein n=1 Tax=Hygrophoropsis aurantiaca TaxID=72124 RepID=A0ACB8ALN2_9AGAM|nr:Rhodanese-like domain-containing protein [Hygrophoropsis aurantiaca]
MSGEELAEIIKSDKLPNKDYLVIDVRDDDWIGGNIKGSRNIPSLTFSATVGELVTEVKDIPTIIFHCALSQLRGPKAAQIYERERLSITVTPSDEEGLTFPDQKIYVLRGGFVQFQEQFRHDPALVENWDGATWEIDSLVDDFEFSS